MLAGSWREQIAVPQTAAPPWRVNNPSLRDLWSASGRTDTPKRSEEREKRAFERLPRVSWASRGHAPQSGGKSAGRRRDASLCPPAGVIHHLNAGGNLWLQFSAFITAALGLGKHAAPAVTPSRRRHIVPLIGPPPPGVR